MKFFKVKMSSRDEFTFDEKTFDKILESKAQLVRTTDYKGENCGVNKAHLVCFREDREVEKEWKQDNIPKLMEPEGEETTNIPKALNNIRKNLENKGALPKR